MELQRQRIDECMIATIAMLSGVSLEHIRTQYKRLVGVDKWCNMTHCTTGVTDKLDDCEWWCAARKIGKYCGLPDSFMKRVAKACWNKRYKLPARHAPRLLGKGCIGVVGCGAHIVAYENGMVYDPRLNKALCWSEWWKRMEVIGFRRYHTVRLRS